MKKIVSFVSVLILSTLLVMGISFANPVPKNGPGFYEHSVTGAIKYFKNGHPDEPSQWRFIEDDCHDCTADLTAEVHPGIEMSGSWVTAPNSNDWAGGQGVGNVSMTGDAFAHGMDTFETSWRWVDGYWTGKPWRSKYVWGHFEPFEVFKTGFAEAFGFGPEDHQALVINSEVDINTNGPQTDGLSFTTVKATTTLTTDAVVWAKGNKGCPQTAFIEIDGSIGAFAYGNSFSGAALGPNNEVNGPYAKAGGQGLTTVSFTGSEFDSSYKGLAFVDFDSTIKAFQGLITKSFTSSEGDMSWNFAKVEGGSGKLLLGDDHLFGKDNIELTGITAEGSVFQSGMATKAGTYAFGSSAASFTGANGSVADIPGAKILCITLPSPGMTANVGGTALVTGFNKVITSPGSIGAVSSQYAYATTGNSAPTPR